jgi:hypothetical protein
LNKYSEKKELRERLVLNHIIFLSNVFGVEATLNMLWFKVEKKNHKVLNSFLVFLNYAKDIECDEELLREIQRRIWQT